MSPLIYSLANDALTYKSEVITFETVREAVFVPQAKVVQSTSKKQIKGSKFIEPPQNIKVVIEEKATKHGVDASLMKAISFCESDYNAKAKNVNVSGSHDGGVAQINDMHLPELKKLGLDKLDAPKQ